LLNTVTSAFLPASSVPRVLLGEGGVGRRPGQHLQGLGAADGLFQMPVGVGEAGQAVAIDGGVELDARVADLDRGVRAGRDDAPL
jgi:hypothetical protein